MANKTIDSLPNASQINDNDLFVLQQNSSAKKLAGVLLKQYIQRVQINDIKSATFNANDQLVITLQDDTVITSASLKGPRGNDGEDGDDGVSPAVSISQTSTGHNVTITDAEHPSGQTFSVEDGEDGTDGVGITSITKTSTAGKVDTYTITLSNGNTSTFTVTNGQDGQGSGDMLSSTYDSDSAVANAGGIADYIDDQGFGTYSKPSGGIPDSDIASASTWNAKSSKSSVITGMLNKDDWSDNQQVLVFPSGTLPTSGYAYIVSPEPQSFIRFASSQIYADDVTIADQMTFHCDTVPQFSLNVVILKQEVV